MSVHWESFHEDCTPLSEAPEVFYKKAVLKNFEIFTGKHLR